MDKKSTGRNLSIFGAGDGTRYAAHPVLLVITVVMTAHLPAIKLSPTV